MDFNFEKDIILENTRVLLRPIAVTDYMHLLPVALADKTLVQYSPSQIHSEVFLKEYIEKAVADRRNNVRYAFSIFDKQANEYAGSTSFGSIFNPDKRLEIGWTWIGRQFQQTGLNRNCKYLMLSYAFDELQFDRVEFRTDERNAESRTAIEKIGGKYEGLLRSHMLMPDGFRRNTIYYSILKSEWAEVKQRFKL